MYAKGEARTLAKGSGCVCVDDATVFGWVIHFFEEDSIKEGAKPKKGVARQVRTAGKAKPAPKKNEQTDSNVLDFFSGLGMGAKS